MRRIGSGWQQLEEDRVLADVPLHRHWRDIYRKRWLILITSFTAAVVAYAFSAQVTPVFESKTTFYIAGNAPSPGYLGAQPDTPPSPLYPIPEEKAASLDVGILRGRVLMSRLASAFDLPFGDVIRKVDIVVSKEFMINVFVRDTDPDLAAGIANTVPTFYADFQETAMRARSTQVVDALESQLAVLIADRDRLADLLRARRAENGSLADDSALRGLQDARDLAEMKLAEFDQQIAQGGARLAALDAALAAEGERFAGFRTMESTPALTAMLERMLDLRIELAAITDGPASPRRAAIEGQIAEIESAMAQEQKRLADAAAKTSGSLFEKLRLERTMTAATSAGLRAARASVAAEIASALDEFGAALDEVAAAQDIASQLARTEQRIATAETNLAAARLQAANARVPMVITETAVAPIRPIFPLTVLNAIVAAIVGLVFGVYYALFVAHSERARRLGRAAEAALPPFSRDELALLRKGDIAAIRNAGGGAGHV